MSRSTEAGGAGAVQQGFLRRAVSGTAAYGASMMVGRVAGILLLRVYTSYLTPADYGVLEIIDIASFLLAMIVGMGLAGDALFYFHAQESTAEGKRDVARTVFTFSLAIGAGGALVGLVGSTAFSEWFFRSGQFSRSVQIAAVGFMFSPPADALNLYLQVSQATRPYMWFALGRTAGTILLNLLLLVVFRAGLNSILISNMVMGMVSVLGLLWYVRKDLGNPLRVRRDLAGKIVRYSYPICIGGASMLLIHYGDRLFLSRYCTLGEIGIYGLGYKLGMVMSYAHQPFQTFWRSQVYTLAAEQDADRVFSEVLLWLVIVFSSLTVGLALMSEWMVSLLATGPFRPAALFVPWIGLGYAVRALEFQMQSVLLVRAKTKLVMVVTGIGTALCLTGYAVLIPHYRLWGAVGSTVGAFTMMCALTWTLALRERPLEMAWRKMGEVVAAGAGMVALGSLLPELSEGARHAVSALMACVYPVAIFMLPGMKRERVIALGLVAKAREAMGGSTR